MKAEDLRIGNYLLNDGVVVKIDGRSIFNMWSLDYGNKYQPIPLTEDWFLKFGFEFVGGWVNEKVLLDSLLYVRDKRTEYIFEYGKGSKITIQYVHQLQNLYFALTGEELQITETAQ